MLPAVVHFVDFAHFAFVAFATFEGGFGDPDPVGDPGTYRGNPFENVDPGTNST